MENFTNLSDRIRQFIDYKDISINKFSTSVGASNSYFNKIIKDNNSIGSDRIEKILRTYPEINAEWLLTGKGEMLKEPAPPAVSSSQPQENDKYTASLEKQVAQLEKINTLQEEKIKGLEQEVAQLKEDLELYIANSSGDILRSNAG